MHISHDTGAQPYSHESVLQPSRSPATAVDNVQEVANRPRPLKLEHQAARQVGVALTSRRITEFDSAGYTELYPCFRESLLLLGQGQEMKQLPAADRSLCHLETITEVLLGHMGGYRLPPAQQRTALCSFLHTLDESSRTALHLTAPDPFMVLAQQQDSHGHSVLYLAVKKGMVELVEWLLNRQPLSFSATDLFTGQNDEQTTPVHLATKTGDVSMVRLLLEKNADVNFQDNGGHTPLHWAAYNGNEEMVRLFLERKAGIDGRTNLCQTPLHLAIFHGDIGTVTLLLDRGSDVNAVDIFNYYSLHYAIEQRDDVRMVALLMDRGARVNAAYPEGRTPLHLAVECGRKNTVRFLLKHGANINLWHGLAESPLQAAIGNDDLGMVYLLLQNDADINDDSYVDPLLHWAIAKDKGEMACVLLENNADVSRRAGFGKTALHIAVQKGNERAIRLLLQKGAGVNAKDYFGNSPLSLAMGKGNERIIQLLRGQ